MGVWEIKLKEVRPISVIFGIECTELNCNITVTGLQRVLNMIEVAHICRNYSHVNRGERFLKPQCIS